jgi:hypothetical protein
MNVLGFVLIALFSGVILCGSRRVAVLAVFASVCYVTQGQALTVAGFNFFAHRIILLAGLIRIVARGELRALKFNRIDWVMLISAVVSTIIPIIRLGVWKEQVGGAYNVLLAYFLFRCLVTDLEDVEQLLPKLAILILPLALCMAFESLTKTNPFNVMGGQLAGWERAGRLRCFGSFRSPHTAGIFGATLVPLFIWLFLRRPQRGAAIAGLVGASVITYTSNSSDPLMAFLSGLVGLAFWPLRKNMRRVRWGIVGLLVVLALSMKAPIWYLMSKVSDVTGGDGWYRSYLMEQCFNHMSDWWLLGTDNTVDWASTHMWWGGTDLCNMYVSCAACCGLAGLVLFVLLLVWCFSALGQALKKTDEIMPQSAELLWCIGSVLFAHVCALFSNTYYDQLLVVWWGFLAVISSVTSSILTQAEAGEELEHAAETASEELPA